MKHTMLSFGMTKSFFAFLTLRETLAKVGIKYLQHVEYQVENHLDDWHAMWDCARNDMAFFKTHSYVRRGLIEPEFVYDDERVGLHLWFFHTEAAERFEANWRQGILCDLETFEPDIDLTLQVLSNELTGTYIDSSILKFIQSQTDSQLKPLKIDMVHKCMIGTKDNVGDLRVALSLDMETEPV